MSMYEPDVEIIKRRRYLRDKSDEIGRFWRTRHIPLVAWLKYEDFDAQRMEMEGRTVYWYFESDEALRECIEEYESGEAMVEPLKYYNTLENVRSEFYHIRREIAANG